MYLYNIYINMYINDDFKFTSSTRSRAQLHIYKPVKTQSRSISFRKL